jgi:capsular polysaccharide biosynthesis protein
MNQFDEIESTDSAAGVREILYLFWSWAWLIVLAGLLAGGAALVVSLRSTPIFQSSTRLLVSDPPALRSIDATGIVSSQTVARTYAEMLLERPVLEGVIAQLGLATSPEDLKETISVELVRDTQLLVVSVEHPSSTLAADIANTIARVFTDRIRELQSQRYAATREGLAKQVSDMEGQIEAVNQALANGMTQTRNCSQARLTEYQRLYASLVTNRAGAPGRSADQHQRGRFRSRRRSRPIHPAKTSRNTCWRRGRHAARRRGRLCAGQPGRYDQEPGRATPQVRPAHPGHDRLARGRRPETDQPQPAALAGDRILPRAAHQHALHRGG